MDWKKIILELVSAGYTQSQIAAEIGLKQPTIAGLMSGSQRDMRWASGQRLIALHRRAVRQGDAAKEPTHA